MKKRIVLMVLVMAMLVSMISGCASETKTETESTAPAETTASAVESESTETAETPAVEEESMWPLEEKASLSCFFPWSPRMVQLGYESPNDFTFYPALEEMTNVHMDFQAVGVDAAQEQFNLLVAGGDYPDLWYNCWDFYPGGGQMALEDEVWMDLAPYMDQLPNYSAALNSDPDYMKYAMLETGAIPQFYAIYTNTYARAGKVIRGDWLDALNLEVPDTNEKLYETAKAFKAEYGIADFMDGTNDPDDEFWSLDFYVMDGVVKYGYMEEDMTVPQLKNKAKWYDEGLVSQETIIGSRTREETFSMVFNGEIGSWEAELDMFSTFNNNAADENFRMEPLPLIKNSEGVAYGSNTDNPIGSSITVSTTTDQLDLILDYFDYWYTDEIVMMANWGVEGETYTLDENGDPHYTDVVFNYEEGMNLAMMVYCIDYGPTIIDYTRNQSGYDDQQKAALALWSDFEDDPYGYPSWVKKSMTSEEGEVIGTYLTDVETYVDETVPKIVFGEYDIDTFYPEFKATLVELGIEKILEVYQAVYDRGMARFA